ncbi:bacillithiol system redox-active protein YtxJ [bacterium]|jgi:bacillithiol system protein YtxJ|nr:bacillithiol system redox-active protein YtxJ [bacterium]
MAWESLDDLSILSQINSSPESQIIFKHSPRCGISSMALRRFEKSDLYKSGNFNFWLLNVLENRELSNSLASEFNVRHESPQVMVFHDKNLVHHASHSYIDAEEIARILKK